MRLISHRIDGRIQKKPKLAIGAISKTNQIESYAKVDANLQSKRHAAHIRISSTSSVDRASKGLIEDPKQRQALPHAFAFRRRSSDSGSDSFIPMQQSKYRLTGHNLVEAAEVDGVGQRRRHGLLATVHRHLGEEARRSHDWLGCC